MNLNQFLLLKLSEECAEVSQRALKQAQFGAEESQATNPFNQREITDEMKLTNAQRLELEINDLYSIVHFLAMLNEVSDDTDFFDHFEAKKKKIRKYLTYSIELNKVDKEALDAFDAIQPEE